MQSSEMFKRDPAKSKIGEELLPVDIGYLPDFFKRKAEFELNYTTSNREKCLLEIKQMISNDPTMENVHYNDEILLLFLNSRKYDLSKAFAQIQKFVDFKKKNTEMFINHKYEAMVPFLTKRFITILPHRCQDGCVIIIFQLENWNAESHNLDAIKKFIVLILIQTLRDPMTQVNGFKVIFDLKVKLGILRICTPQNLYLLYYATQVIFPARFKAMHLVNMGVPGEALYNIMKIFLSEKLKKRIYIHKTHDTLFNHLPKAILPLKYGGELNNYDMSEWLRKVTTPETLAFMDLLSS